jgi:hypothetical protein
MKRRYLHFSLLLIFIILGGSTIGLYSFKNAKEYTPRQKKSELQLPRIKPASEHLAKIRNNQHTGVINPSDLKNARKQLKNMTSSRALELKWTQLGPDNFGGRTRVILFDNQDPSSETLYAASVSGGIWKSTNVGVTWRKVNSEASNLYVSCMTQTPDGTIYAGTGESFAVETMSGFEQMGYSGGFMGQGIYKSTDGDNFSLIASTSPTYNDPSSDWAYVNEIAYDQANNRVYAATNTGLKYSNDAGQNWLTATDTSGAELGMNSFDVQVNSSGVAIACVDNKCYLSQDGNINNFILRSTGDSISLPDMNVSRIEFAFAPSDDNVVYASVVNEEGNVYNIYRSDDSGYTWKVILPGTPSIPVFLGQGVYDNAITVFPNNPYKVLLGGFVLYQGQMIDEEGLYDWTVISEGFTDPLSPSYLHFDVHTMVFQPGSDNTFFVGTDGGVTRGTLNNNIYTYVTSNRNYYTTQFYAIGNSGRENFNLGGAQDNGTILITGETSTTRQGTEIQTGDGGPCVSSLINKDIIVVTRAAAPTSAGKLRRSEDAGANYSTQFLGEDISNAQAFRTPVALWENFNNPNSRDSVAYHAQELIEGGTTIQVRSQNSGQPFYYDLPADVTLQPGDSIMVKDVVSSVLALPVVNNVWLTYELHNFGKVPEWFNISGPSVGFNGLPYSIAFSADGNHLFVGTIEGKLFRISNLALAYNYDRADISSPSCVVATTEIPLLVPGTSDNIDQVVTSIVVDPSSPNKVMITLGNYGNDHYILYSANALDEVPVFSSRQGNLPKMPVYSSLIEMTDNNIAIIGTELGIFVTENIMDDTPEWYTEQDAMGQVPVFDLKQQIVSKAADEVVLVNGNEVIVIPYPGTNNFGIIYAATYGRGLFRCNNFRKPVGIEDIYTGPNFKQETLRIFPNPVLSKATIAFDITHKGEAILNVTDLSGRVISSSNIYVNEGENEIIVDLSNLTSGTYIMRMVSGKQIIANKFIVK